MKQNYEFGRSMVEILGVLVIIGVLSVGGIMGYSYGMDKYRANETIHEINMRLLTLQTQSERDMDLNLNEFADTTLQGYTVGDNYGWAEDDTRIYVGISGIGQGACEIIYDEMITKVERIDVTADRTADMNTLCGDNNEMKFYVGSGVEVRCDPACREDEYCMSGIKCVKAWKDERIKCTPGDNTPCGECMTCAGEGHCTPLPNNGTECEAGNGICVNGVCTNKDELDIACKENSDCSYGYYCALKTQGCYPEPYGCAPIDFSPFVLKLSDGTTELWYRSNVYMSWHNALAACEAMGKKVPSKAELDKEKKSFMFSWTSTRDEKYCYRAYVTYKPAPWQDITYPAAFALCR